MLDRRDALDINSLALYRDDILQNEGVRNSEVRRVIQLALCPSLPLALCFLYIANYKKLKLY